MESTGRGEKMIEIFLSGDEGLRRINEIVDGAWINIVNPTEEEIEMIAGEFPVELVNLRAALDEEERARIEVDTGYTLILVDVPVNEKLENGTGYFTIPLGILLFKENIITVCTREIPILKDFITGAVRGFYTFKKIRFILQILYKNASYFLQYLKQIDRASNRIERELHKSMKNKELIQLLELEKALVYFSTSLRSNEAVMEKMMRLDTLKKYPDDAELLEDVIIENKQAIEMANIYSNILSGMMGAFASVISNNVNIIMKMLTSITIVMTIPNIVSGFFGMNVNNPLMGYNHAFPLIFGITLVLSIIVAAILMRKKMF
jgi:magnesium transporter